jgi:fatty-acyl-CoA synthase
VEDALYRHPSVATCGVVAREDEKWGEVPVAYVELKPGATASEEEIIVHCRALLARFKVPKAVIFAEIPKTSTGKIQKFRLREMARR